MNYVQSKYHQHRRTKSTRLKTHKKRIAPSGRTLFGNNTEHQEDERVIKVRAKSKSSGAKRNKKLQKKPKKTQKYTPNLIRKFSPDPDHMSPEIAHDKFQENVEFLLTENPSNITVKSKLKSEFERRLKPSHLLQGDTSEFEDLENESNNLTGNIIDCNNGNISDNLNDNINNIHTLDYSTELKMRQLEDFVENKIANKSVDDSYFHNLVTDTKNEIAILKIGKSEKMKKKVKPRVRKHELYSDSDEERDCPDMDMDFELSVEIQDDFEVNEVRLEPEDKSISLIPEQNLSYQIEEIDYTLRLVEQTIEKVSKKNQNNHQIEKIQEESWTPNKNRSSLSKDGSSKRKKRTEQIDLMGDLERMNTGKKYEMLLKRDSIQMMAQNFQKMVRSKSGSKKQKINTADTPQLPKLQIESEKNPPNDEDSFKSPEFKFVEAKKAELTMSQSSSDNDRTEKEQLSDKMKKAEDEKIQEKIDWNKEYADEFDLKLKNKPPNLSEELTSTVNCTNYTKIITSTGMSNTPMSSEGHINGSHIEDAPSQLVIESKFQEGPISPRQQHPKAKALAKLIQGDAQEEASESANASQIDYVKKYDQLRKQSRKGNAELQFARLDSFERKSFEKENEPPVKEQDEDKNSFSSLTSFGVRKEPENEPSPSKRAQEAIGLPNFDERKQTELVSINSSLINPRKDSNSCSDSSSSSESDIQIDLYLPKRNLLKRPQIKEKHKKSSQKSSNKKLCNRRKSSQKLLELSQKKQFKEDSISLLPVSEQIKQPFGKRKDTQISEISPLMKQKHKLHNPQEVANFNHSTSARTLDIKLLDIPKRESEGQTCLNYSNMSNNISNKVNKSGQQYTNINSKVAEDTSPRQCSLRSSRKKIQESFSKVGQNLMKKSPLEKKKYSMPNPVTLTFNKSTTLIEQEIPKAFKLNVGKSHIQKKPEDLEYENVSQKLLEMIANFDKDMMNSSLTSGVFDTLDSENYGEGNGSKRRESSSNRKRAVKEPMNISNIVGRHMIEVPDKSKSNHKATLKSKNIQFRRPPSSSLKKKRPKTPSKPKLSSYKYKRRSNKKKVKSSPRFIAKNVRANLSSKKLCPNSKNKPRKSQQSMKRRVIEIEELDDSLENTGQLNHYNPQKHPRKKSSSAFGKGIQVAEQFLLQNNYSIPSTSTAGDDKFEKRNLSIEASLNSSKMSASAEIQGLDDLINSRVMNSKKSKKQSSQGHKKLFYKQRA